MVGSERLGSSHGIEDDVFDLGGDGFSSPSRSMTSRLLRGLSMTAVILAAPLVAFAFPDDIAHLETAGDLGGQPALGSERFAPAELGGANRFEASTPAGSPGERSLFNQALLGAEVLQSPATTMATTTTTTWQEPAVEPESQWVDAGNGVAVPDLLLRIRFCESTNNYRAAHVVSSASGAYQFLTKSWNWYGHAERYGVASAAEATPAQQDEAALATWRKDGARPWAESRPCWDSPSIAPNYATAPPPATPPAPTTTTTTGGGGDESTSSTEGGSDTTTTTAATTTTGEATTSSSSTSSSTSSTSSSTPTEAPDTDGGEQGSGG